MSKSQEKKSTFFPKYFQQNRHLKKIQIFRKYTVYFQILLSSCISLSTHQVVSISVAVPAPEGGNGKL